MVFEPLVVVATLARVFDDLNIRYVVGGSLASSMYGIPRATQDADLVAEISQDSANLIERALAGEFFVDADMIRKPVAHRGSFNVVHLASMLKADVFIARDDAWSHEQMRRGREEMIDVGGSRVTIRFATAEDTLLHKLVWYRLGERTSERQWNDVLGVLRIQDESLDYGYLERWALVLNVADLLDEARKEP